MSVRPTTTSSPSSRNVRGCSNSGVVLMGSVNRWTSVRRRRRAGAPAGSPLEAAATAVAVVAAGGQADSSGLADGDRLHVVTSLLWRVWAAPAAGGRVGSLETRRRRDAW